MKNKLIIIILSILSAYILFIYIHAIIFANFNGDSGYYLSLANQVIEGKRLYLDVANGYTPIAIYCYSFLFMFSKNPIAIFAFNIFITFASGFTLFFILKSYIFQYKLRLFISLLFIATLYIYEATSICLEPFVNLFGLISIALLLKWRENKNSSLIFLSGLFIGISFLSKQYGIYYSLFAGLFVIFNSRGIIILIKTWLQLFLGFLFPLILIIIIYIFLEIPPLQFLSSLVNTGYGEKSLSILINAVTHFSLRNCALLIFIPILLFRMPPKFKTDLLCFLVLLFFLFSVFFIQNYPHYTLLLLPSSFIIIVILYASLSNVSNQIIKKSFIILSLFFILNNIRISLNAFITHNNYWNREEQLELSKTILNHCNNQDKVLLFDHYENYFLCNFKPVFPKTLGYAYINSLTEDQLEASIRNAEVILVDKANFNNKLDKNNFRQIPKTSILINKF